MRFESNLCFAAIAVLLSACSTNPLQKTDSISRDAIQGRWPVAAFEEHDPYPSGYTGSIHAYVEFGKDGLLRATLGCIRYGAPYKFMSDGTLFVDKGLIREYTDSDPTNTFDKACPDELIMTELILASFLLERPKMNKLDARGLELTSGRKSLLLQSISEVLEENSTAKELQ